jgi:polygalacturonase
MTDYPANAPDYNFFRRGKIKRALIYAERCRNIAIKGEGTIDGRGDSILIQDGKPVETYGERPHVIWMIQSKGIEVSGIKLQNSALWMQHYLACENIYIHNIEVFNHCNKNNDMIDINGCKDVIISDSRGDSDDDGITIKSTHAMPSENILINNCVLSSHCNAIKCGTESNAGFKNIVVSNCIIRPSKKKSVIYGKPAGISGISLEVVDGAEMNGISISNVVIEGTAVPLFIRLGNRARGYDKNLPKPKVGTIENITISNLTAYNVGNHGSSISGIPGHNVKNITLDNIRIFYKGGGTTEDVINKIPEKETDYPEATMFGKLSSYGLFVRHAENITISNIEVHFNSNDKRPALHLENLKNGKVINLQADIDSDNTLIVGRNISDIFIQNPQASQKCKSVIELSGSETKNIRLTEIDKSLFDTVYQKTKDINKSTIKTGVVYQ